MPFETKPADRVYFRQTPSQGSRAWWAAIARWHQDDRRWQRLVDRQESVELLRVGNSFRMQRRGPDLRFVGTSLLIPAGTWRERSGDVMDPTALAQWHLGYRHRIIIGPSYRADMWAIAEQSAGGLAQYGSPVERMDPSLRPGRCGRTTSCSPVMWQTACSRSECLSRITCAGSRCRQRPHPRQFFAQGITGLS